VEAGQLGLIVARCRLCLWQQCLQGRRGLAISLALLGEPSPDAIAAALTQLATSLAS